MAFDIFNPYMYNQGTILNFLLGRITQNPETTYSILLAILFCITLWSIAWKGWALWVAAKNNQPKWFVALLIINTLGLFEIAYLLYHYNKGTLHRKKED